MKKTLLSREVIMHLRFCLPLALLFLTIGVPSNAQNAAEEKVVSVAEGAPLSVVCTLRVEQRAVWRLDGGEVPSDMRPAGESPAGDGRLAARLQVAAARPAHAGVYTCSRQRDGTRVRVLVTGISTGEPSASAASAPAAAPPAAADADDAKLLVYDVKGPLLLNCTRPAATGLNYKWSKNKTELSEVPELGGPSPRYKLLEDGAVFKIEHAHEEDYGNYSCSAGGETLAWNVRGRPVARLPPDSNVVEGQKIKIQCRVIGKPYPRVTWSYKNSSEGNGTEIEAGERFKLEASEAGVEDGALVLAEARRSDAGEYVCAPADGAAAATTLRVKDMYAALWPFLGICAEVFVLCAIILVYEKRRTKPELDDSDTDNHDQKKS